MQHRDAVSPTADRKNGFHARESGHRQRLRKLLKQSRMVDYHNDFITFGAAVGTFEATTLFSKRRPK
jgi:hypothetical protein